MSATKEQIDYFENHIRALEQRAETQKQVLVHAIACLQGQLGYAVAQDLVNQLNRQTVLDNTKESE